MRSLQEKNYLNLCKQKIEAIINIGDNTGWIQQDYEHLSDLIYEKTNVQLSVSTLKRLWVYKTDTIPNITTLNTLSRFLNYRDWYDFKNKHIIGNNKDVPSKPKRKIYFLKWNRKISVYIAIALTLLTTIIIFMTNRYTSINSNDIIFELKQNRLLGVPNTVVFHYDISKTGFDSAFIQQDWDDEKQVKVSAMNKHFSCIYYYPGYFDAKLIVGNKVIKHSPLLIKTEGWLPMVKTDRYQEKPIYIDKKIIENQNLHISPEYIKTLGIDITKDYFVSFYKVRDFENIKCDNFTLISEIKNNVEEGGSSCQYSEIVLKFENGRLLTPFSNIGCTSTLNVHYGDKNLKGSENDFSALGTNLSDWKTIKIQAINKHVSVFIEGKKVFDLAFNASLGKLVGLHYLFNGCGSVREIKLFDQNNILVYSDYFVNKHKAVN